MYNLSDALRDITNDTVVMRRESNKSEYIHAKMDEIPEGNSQFTLHEVLREGVHKLYFDFDMPIDQEDSLLRGLTILEIVDELYDATGECMYVYSSTDHTKISLHIILPYVIARDTYTLKMHAKQIIDNLPEYGKYYDVLYKKNQNLRILGHYKYGTKRVKKALFAPEDIGSSLILEYTYSGHIPKGVRKLKTIKPPPMVDVGLSTINVDKLRTALGRHIEISRYSIRDVKTMDDGGTFIGLSQESKHREMCPLCGRIHDKPGSLYVYSKGDRYMLKCYRTRAANLASHINLILNVFDEKKLDSVAMDWF